MSSALHATPREGLIPLGTTGYWTDRDTLRVEADFFQMAQAALGALSPLEFSSDELKTQKELFLKHTKSRVDPVELSEQLEAIFGTLDRRALLSVITGPPGAAKSTIASLWARIARSKYPDLPILVLAQEKTALQRLKDKVDIADSTAWTMEDALNKTAPWPRGAAIIVDEAGLFGTETLARLLKKAQDIEAPKIILVGDDKQLVSDAPGQPFRWLCAQDQTDAVVLQNSFRQKNLWLRQAVTALYQSNIEEALRLMPCHFVPQEGILLRVEQALNDASPDSTLVIVHGCPGLLQQLPNALPDFRVLSLAESQGLAIDRVVLVLGREINMGELLVGCSRQRFDLDVVVDTAVYKDAPHFIAAVQPYPKNLMVLDVMSPQEMLQMVQQAA